MIQRLSILVLGSLAFWVLTAVPAKHLLQIEHAWLYSGTALALCLLPAALTLAWLSWAARRDPAQQATWALGATGVRLFGVLIAALLLRLQVPVYAEHDSFLFWLIVFYLFTLALEMTLLLRGRARPGSPA